MSDHSDYYTVSLTEREIEVLTLIEAGHSNNVIAQELVLSYHTVTWHVKQIFSKLSVNRRTQAVAVAHALGLLGEGASTGSALAVPRHNLPIQSTSFVGREEETAQIAALLNDANCRLVTLVGPGGIGKTRLALEVVAQKRHEYADGALFVALQPLTSPEKIIPTIAKTLGSEQQLDRQNPRRSLFNFFREKSVLLLMDNFEHVIEGGQIVSDLLAVAPSIKIVVTSRESLNLREEYLFNVDGLPFPADEQIPNGSFQAVDLFDQRARQVCPDFSLENAWPDVAEICRLVVGMPLAIELAASWLKVLSCKEIAAEIQQGLDRLATTMRNVPERHRSMWATFNASWNALNEEERAVFRQLSVFRGGCTREAARQVTGANRWLLQSLADKSYIRRDVAMGRFDIHELLRQYGEYHLEKAPADVVNAHDRHCLYYMELLARHRENVISQRQMEMMAALEPELDNIRTAWQWAAEQRRADDILGAVHTLAYFHVFRGRFLEEVEMLETAVHDLNAAPPTKQTQFAIAVLLSYLGWVYIRVGDMESAETSFKRSQLLYRSVDEPPPKGLGTEPLTGLAMLACIQGEYDEAESLGEKTRRVCQERDDPLNQQLGEYALISAYIHQGRYEEARVVAEIWVAMNEETGGRWNLAEPFNTMGNISRLMGKYEQARAYYEKSYEIRREFNDPQGMAAAQNFMGMTAVAQGDITAAKRHYQESHELYKKIGDRGGVGYALCGLGDAAIAAGEYNEAHHCFYQALAIVDRIHYMPVLFLALIGIAELLILGKRPSQGVEILTFVRRHEQCGHEARERVAQILERVSAGLDAETYQTAVQRGQELCLDNIVPELLENM